MPYQITKLPDDPIIVIHVDPKDFSPVSARAFQTELTALLDAQPGPVYLINVLPEDFTFDMEDLLQATQIIKAQSHLYQHRNIQGMAAVTTSDPLKLAYNGLSNEVFGGIHVRAFGNFEDAVAWVHSQK